MGSWGAFRTADVTFDDSSVCRVYRYIFTQYTHKPCHLSPHLLVEVDGPVVPAEAGLSARAEVAADGHQDLGGVLVMADVRTRVVLVTRNPAHGV